MANEFKLGQSVKITISKTVNRASARKTLERLFMQDKATTGPLDARSANFIPLPKRRGGCIWTKRVNKVHPLLERGNAAMVKVTPQTLRDLKSVSTFVELA